MRVERYGCCPKYVLYPQEYQYYYTYKIDLCIGSYFGKLRHLHVHVFVAVHKNNAIRLIDTNYSLLFYVVYTVIFLTGEHVLEKRHV